MRNEYISPHMFMLLRIRLRRLVNLFAFPKYTNIEYQHLAEQKAINFYSSNIARKHK